MLKGFFSLHRLEGEWVCLSRFLFWRTKHYGGRGWLVLDRKTHTHTNNLFKKTFNISIWTHFFCLLFVHQMLKYICGCCFFFYFFICWTSVWQSRSVCVYSSSATYLKNIYKFYTYVNGLSLYIFIHWQDNNGVYPYIHWI